MNTPPPPPLAPHPRRPAASLATTALAGALVMMLGLAWLSSNLGLFNGWFDRAVSIWPVILILLGLTNLVGPRQHRSLLGLLLIAAGAWALATEQAWVPVPFWAGFAPTAGCAPSRCMRWTTC